MDNGGEKLRWSWPSGTFRGTRRFEAIRCLGTGGMGEVYEVVDRDSGSTVALKVLSALSPEALLRFKNEFRTLQKIRHRNLVCLHELLEEDGLWFFTMEFVPGVDLLRHVRPLGVGASADAPRFDESRLRNVLLQLALGLRELHGAGMVHRDVKPSNILVTGEGRVVLLDFGLVAEAKRSSWLSAQRVLGTPAFMSPEQAAGGHAGIESDWYAVGGVLYVALTGQVPFDGSADEMLYAKQHRDPPAPSALVSGVPADLDELCVSLLRLHPAARPTGEEVLRRLQSHSDAPSAVQAESPPSSGTPFVGRERELVVLEQAFAESRHDHAVVVEVHGESGIGKSALVRRFTDRMALQHGAVVLSGRCYESEAVPFKAVDGIIDSLTAYMASLPGEDAAALLPLRASLLAQVFPVLRRVPAIAAAPLAQQAVLDPHELRARVFAALRELLLRLAERRPLVLVIDDLQWTDADSLLMLGDVLRPPDAPALLLVATVRDVPGRAAPNEPARMPLTADVRHLHLEPLQPDEARELATVLLRAFAGGGRVDPAAIAAEAGGHPLFIDELVRHGVASGGRASAPLVLEDVLWDRIKTLGEPASRILAILAIADMPISQAILASSAATDRAELSRQLAQLRSASLVHMTGVRGADWVQCCHDRVRAAVTAHVDPDSRRDLHRSLALALEASDRADPEALALHWLGAGDRDRAAHYATQAAAQAGRAFAFDRSAKLYQQALELCAPGDPAARRLRVELAGALVNAGRGLEAAETFLQAVPGAGAAEALDLQRSAAEQFLISGHIERGLQALEAVLAEFGVQLPKTPRHALISLLQHRLVLRLRGLRWKPKDASEIPSRQLTRLDIYKAVSLGLGMVDTIRGADFQARGLLLALRTGERRRVGRSISFEATYHGSQGRKSLPRALRLLEQARAIADESKDPYLQFWIHGSEGVIRYFEGRFHDSADACAKALTVLPEATTGLTWEQSTTRIFRLYALRQLGACRELRRWFDEYLRDAVRRGDRYSQTTMARSCILAWLVDDQPSAALEELEKTPWMPPTGAYHLQHWYALRARTEVALYEGRSAEALEAMQEGFVSLSRSLLSRIQIVRSEARWLYGRLLLAQAGASGDAFAEQAERLVHQLQRERMPYSDLWARLLAAALAERRGRRDEAIAMLRRAALDGDQNRLALCALAARHRWGTLAGGDQGAALVAQAIDGMRSDGIRNPVRMVELVGPGFAGG